MKHVFYKLSSTLILGAACIMGTTVCLADAIFSADFNSGLPAGTSVFGNAFVDNTGGVSNSGVLKLTNAVNSQAGYFYINDLEPGVAVDSFTATFKAYLGGGTCCGQGFTADGFSFNFANDLPISPSFLGEEGAGTGLTVAFDSWDNGGPEAPAIEIKQGGVLIGRVFTTTVSQGPSAAPNFWDVFINLDPDGTLDVSYNNVSIFSNFATGYTAITNGRFGFGARTGGANDNHWFDDLTIQTRVLGSVPEPSAPALLTLSLAVFVPIFQKRRKLS